MYLSIGRQCKNGKEEGLFITSAYKSNAQRKQIQLADYFRSWLEETVSVPCFPQLVNVVIMPYLHIAVYTDYGIFKVIGLYVDSQY